MAVEEDYSLTKAEVVLHELNRASIDSFLHVHGFEIAGQDWGRKIKVVLLIIEEIQMGIRKEKYTKK